MAKTKRLQTDDFDFDAGLDMPDFGGLDIEPPKDDRNPVSKFASGALGGVKDAATSPDFIRRLVRDSLPPGYGQVMDVADQGAGTIRNLYNTASKELKPAINDIKRTTNRLLPTVEKVLPKSVTERIKGWAKEDKKTDPRSTMEEMREANLQAELGEIFTAQSEVDQHNRAEDKIQSTLRDGMQQKQHKDQMGQLDQMRFALQQGVNFDTRITSRYQRKHLEIAYRTYYLNMDMLEETRRQNAVTTSNLEGILKNTGLPEFVKLKNSERLKEALRNKFVDGLNDTVFAKRRQFFQRIGKQLNQTVQDRARSFADSVQQGAGMSDSLADLQQMQADFGGPGMSGAELGGGIVGGGLVDNIGGRLGRKGRKLANATPWLVRGGNKASEIASNLPQYAEEFARSSKGETSNFGLWNSMVRFGKDTILGAMGGQDTTLQQDKIADGNNPDIFGRRTNKSITETIPGYLARIWREIKILRTGDTSTPLVEYDYLKNTFNDRNTIAANIRQSLFGENETSSTKNQVDKLVKELSKDSNLTPEQQKILGRYMLQQNLKGKRGNVDVFSDDLSYTGEAQPHAEAFSEMFKKYFKEDPTLDKRRVFSQEFSNLGTYISDSRAKIQDHVNAGQRDYLEEMGIVDPKTGMIDMEKIYAQYYGDTPSAGPGGPAPTATPGRRASRQRGGNTPNRDPNVRRQLPHIVEPAPAAPVPAAPLPPPAAPQTVHFQPDPSMFDRVIASIETNSSRDASVTMGETLLRIEQQIAAGIQMHTDGPGGPRRLGDLGNLRVRDVPGKLLEQGRRGLSWARGFGKSQIDRGANTAKTAWNMLGKWKDKAVLKINEINDVYVQGELMPRLTRAKILAGEYRDQATGEVIRRVQDIKGAIVDAEGNIVLSLEDAKKAFMKTNMGQKALGSLTRLKDATVGAGLWGIRKLRASAGGVYGLGLDAVQKLWGLTDRAQDVYVKGEPTPRLLGITMKAGGYASKISSKTITKPSEIDGPVYDSNGQLVLTQEDLTKGLVGADGRPIVTGIKKVARMLLDAGKFVKDKAMWAKNKVLGAAKGAKDWVAGKLDFGNWGAKLGKVFNTGPLGISAKKTVDLLTEIRNILNDRLPGKSRKVGGDSDGDGIRDGSYADLQRKKKAAGSGETLKDKFAKLKGKGHEKGKDLYDTITDKAKGAWDSARGLFGGDDEGSIDVDRDDRRRRRNRSRRGTRNPRSGGRGIWGKTKNLAGRAASGAGRYGRGALSAARTGLGAVGGAGRAAGGMAGTLGRGAMMAGRGAMMLGGLGLSGVASAGGALLSGAATLGAGAVTGAAGLAGTIATGLGAVLTAPVLLTALGVAAVGVGGYFAYKYLTRKQLGLLSTVRYAQYGFTKDDTDHLQKVFGLEETLAPHVVFTGEQAALDESKIDLKKAIEDFGIDVVDPGQRGPWVEWFTARFKPVFLGHMSVLTKMKKKLSDVDNFEGEERKTYFNATKLPAGPYDFVTSPFPDLPRLKAGRAEVNAAIAEVDAVLAKDTKGSKKGPTLGESAKSAASVVAASSVLSADGIRNTTPAQMQSLAKAVKLDGSGAVLSGPGVVTISSSAVMADVLFTGRLDGLTAIRMRTYGLKEMSTDKVRTLQKLEQLILPQVSFDSTDTAKWTGSIEETVNTAGAWFGVAGSTNGNSAAWLTWFTKRFLPTYLKYLTALKKITGKSDMKVAENTLKAQQKLDIATVVYTTTTDYGGSSATVWSVAESPWPGFDINMDVKSVEGNLQGLKESAQAGTLDEEQGKSGTRSGLSNTASDIVKNGVTGKAGFFDRFFKGVDEDGNQAKSWVGNAADTVMGGIKDFGRGVADTLGFGGGKEVDHPGKGTGGDINSLPKPTGKGYAAMKDLIGGVAKMTGVDAKMISSVMAVESGFDPSVKAKSSSATGLGQFIKDTWDTMLARFGPKYGIAPGTPPTDARANALMTAEYLKLNAEQIKGSVNRKLTDTDLYMAHFLGAGGARQFLSADPNAIAANVMPKAARSNESIFYDKSRGGAPRTVGQVYALMNSKLRAKAKALGVEDGSEKLQTTTAPATPALSSNPVGDFKVTEQTPGVPIGAKTNVPQAVPAAAPTPATAGKAGAAPATAAAAVSAAAVAGGGFQTPRSASVEEQGKNQAQASAKMFEGFADIQNNMLTTQRDMLKELRALVAQGIAAATNKGQPAPAEPSPTPKAPARPVQDAPVPFSKKTNWP